VDFYSGGAGKLREPEEEEVDWWWRWRPTLARFVVDAGVKRVRRPLGAREGKKRRTGPGEGEREGAQIKKAIAREVYPPGQNRDRGLATGTGARARVRSPLAVAVGARKLSACPGSQSHAG